MNNDFLFKWKLILLFQLEFTALGHQSIAGVTYMDNFDFEERYRNVHDCDPFHWHPLHLPEHCAEMYENLIRSRIAEHRPVKVVREYDTYFGYPTFQVMDDFEYERPPLSPYEKMLDLLRKDVARNPSAPSIGMMPNIGPVAVYRQPISKKSRNMIKKISAAYAKAGRKNHGGKYYGKIEINGPPEIAESDKEVKSKDKINTSNQTEIITLQR